MDSIVLTDAALLHVKKTLAKRGSGIGLRIAVKTTGCSGLSYVVDIVDEAKPDDHCCPQADGSLVLVEAKSYPFVQGMLVDYTKAGLNESFTFSNPNAQGVCGCGESFSVQKSAKEQ